MALIAVGVMAAAARAEEAAPQPLRLPVVVHMARADGAALAGEPEAAQMIEIVNQIYDGSGVCFALAEVREVARDADLVSYRDRRILKKFVVPRAINVFVVRSIKDPSPSDATRRASARVGREPTGWLRGAEIPAVGKRPEVYLLVTLTAGAPTLAHELGHFLGAGHHPDPDNLMSYGSGRNGFDDKQFRTFRAHARGELRKGALKAATSCAP